MSTQSLATNSPSPMRASLRRFRQSLLRSPSKKKHGKQGGEEEPSETMNPAEDFSTSSNSFSGDERIVEVLKVDDSKTEQLVKTQTSFLSSSSLSSSSSSSTTATPSTLSTNSTGSGTNNNSNEEVQSPAQGTQQKHQELEAKISRKDDTIAQLRDDVRLLQELLLEDPPQEEENIDNTITEEQQQAGVHVLDAASQTEAIPPLEEGDVLVQQIKSFAQEVHDKEQEIENLREELAATHAKQEDDIEQKLWQQEQQRQQQAESTEMYQKVIDANDLALRELRTQVLEKELAAAATERTLRDELASKDRAMAKLQQQLKETERSFQNTIEEMEQTLCVDVSVEEQQVKQLRSELVQQEQDAASWKRIAGSRASSLRMWQVLFVILFIVQHFTLFGSQFRAWMES